jgi:hypothetical protein
MKIRLEFRCSRCGSKSFRPSGKRAFKDLILRAIGITPQRCFKCRRRFYLYRPAIVLSLLRVLVAPPVPARQGAALQPEKAKAKAAVASDVVWSRFAKADRREGDS